jgi:hypothetical protein
VSVGCETGTCHLSHEPGKRIIVISAPCSVADDERTHCVGVLDRYGSVGVVCVPRSCSEHFLACNLGSDLQCLVGWPCAVRAVHDGGVFSAEATYWSLDERAVRTVCRFARLLFDSVFASDCIVAAGSFRLLLAGRALAFS